MSKPCHSVLDEPPFSDKGQMHGHEPERLSPMTPHGLEAVFHSWDLLETPLFVLDASLRCVHATPAACELLRAPLRVLLGKPICGLFSPATARHLEAADRRLMDLARHGHEQQKSTPCEAELLAGDAPRRMTLHRRCCKVPAAGGALHLVVRMEDHGERDMLAGELRCLGQALSSSSDLFAVTDAACRVLHANLAFCKALGLPQERIEGHFLADLLGERIFAEGLRSCLQRCLAGENVVSQSWLGARRMDIICTPSSDAAGTPRAILLCRDVTHLSAGLHTSLTPVEDFRRFYDNMRDACFYLDLGGRIRAANPPAVALVGRTLDELQHASFARLLCPDADCFNTLLERMGQSESLQGQALEIRHQDGRTFSCHCSMRSVRDLRGEPIGLEVALQLVAPPGEESSEPHGYRIFLERRVLERTSELTRTNKMLLDKILELEAARRELSEYRTRLRELAYELSLVEQRERRRLALELHDGVGQDLAMARIRLSSLKGRLAPIGLAAQCDELLALIKKMIDESRCLVWEMGSPELYELGFEAAIEELADEFQDRHSLDVTCRRHHAEPLELSQDQQIMLFQMVRELLTNVVKHAGATSVIVDIGNEARHIVCSVIDDGQGFPPQSEAAARPKRDSGFGLFSIRERLNLIGGTLEIRSTEHGSRCRLSVPVFNAPPDTAAQKPSRSPFARSHEP